MTYLNAISFFGILGLCLIAWAFSEDRRVIPWRVIIGGIGLQLILGFLVFQFPATRELLRIFSGLLDSIFTAADAGARFVFGPNLVPLPGQDPLIVRPLPPGAAACPPPQVPFIPGYCGTDKLNYILAFRALPAVIFFSGLMSLLYNLGVIQAITNVFAKVFYRAMRLSGAESLSGAANIFVGIEAAIAVKPYIPKMTRSELCAILACCFGTAASSTLAIYVSYLRPVFPNILGHLVSASIMAIPACFVLSKILVPETSVPETIGGIPEEKKPVRGTELEAVEEAERRENIAEKVEERYPQTKIQSDEDDSTYEGPKETVGGEPIERVSPMDAAILGALDGVKMAVSIAAVLILILGLVSLINQLFGGLAGLPGPIGEFFKVVTLQNILGFLFVPVTFLTGVSLDPNELWKSSVIIGRRLFETAIPPYQELGRAAAAGELSDRAVLIISYALSGFAHIASVGIFVGGTIALAPSRRKDISQLGWKALFVGTLATIMIACIAGLYDNGNPSILGEKAPPVPVTSPTSVPTAPSPTVSPTASPTTSPTATPSPRPIPSPTTTEPALQNTVKPIPAQTPKPTPTRSPAP
ncbi:nucleoside transporter C-terminal domain-containing protein [Leptothermofonsia sp. ETS-13]|uniref:NupC/NupG family nucleoside CNT transporter n=1 Tax=Leptothermofonsia sp. ETS-13 TaxID=3035696 RepID=UPI003BA1C3C1